MGVIMAERTLKRTAQRYRRSTRKQKARILDEFVATHDCTRKPRELAAAELGQDGVQSSGW